MRICLIGKYPPIQGGVSMRTFRTAHALAARGHHVHVITNALEVTPPFRAHMRKEDWERCERRYRGGAVAVHWTDPIDRTQSYIPMSSPFVSKLAGLALTTHESKPFDVIMSHYLEPYAIAGHLTAQLTGKPHVVRTAGSDAGRLWRHQQLEKVYDHVLRGAAAVVATGPVAKRCVERGVLPDRIVPGGAFRVPESEFATSGLPLDLAVLRRETLRQQDLDDAWWGNLPPGRPYFGIYGKLGDKKGSFALLSALRVLALKGLDVGLLAMAHGRPEIEKRFREQATDLGLEDRIQQIPFLPPWRVPEFLRGCLAICCLEQDFPIEFHSPIIPVEVLLSGRCLVVSRELLKKLPRWELLPHGHGCVGINDVNDAGELSSKLEEIVRRPDLARTVGARGQLHAIEYQAEIDFPGSLERILVAAAKGRGRAQRSSVSADEIWSAPFRLTEIAGAALARKSAPRSVHNAQPGLPEAERILARLRTKGATTHPKLQALTEAVAFEIIIARTRKLLESETRDIPHLDSCTLVPDDYENHFSVVNPSVRVVKFAYDMERLVDVTSVDDFPKLLRLSPTYVAVFRNPDRELLLIDRFSVRMLELSDGAHTVDEIAEKVGAELGASKKKHMRWFENLLRLGLICLHDARCRPRVAPSVLDARPGRASAQQAKAARQRSR